MWELLLAIALGFGGGYIYKDCPECREIEIDIPEGILQPHVLPACKEGTEAGIDIFCMTPTPRYVIREQDLIDDAFIFRARTEALKRCLSAVDRYNANKTSR